jgi:hypothetical protein
MLSAGAREVIWIQSPVEGLAEPLKMAMGMLSGCDGLIIEGNSPIEFLEPDVVIFQFGKDLKRIKPSAIKALKKADLIICHSTNPSVYSFISKEFGLSNIEILSSRLKRRRDLQKLKALVVDKIAKKDKINILQEKLLRTARDNRLACDAARRIAEEEGISYLELGRLADKLRIKISDCELGCF